MIDFWDWRGWKRELQQQWHTGLGPHEAREQTRAICEGVVKIFEWSTVAGAFYAAGEKTSSSLANFIGLIIVAITTINILSYTPFFWSAGEHKLPGRKEAYRRWARIIVFSLSVPTLNALILATLKPLIASLI
ncbi:hypothetical protein GCM10008179_14910 [Hansschlegelia plantiphila]|uniref:Uncharacterized protein n=1 Tax=Hansschlegelia plantiphila TaxID=374655 RepID=A0A9W6J1V4_9HYPH|nr:hypothetical protein GCM10008179_14910 [Hansschlegelia plantiphila]